MLASSSERTKPAAVGGWGLGSDDDGSDKRAFRQRILQLDETTLQDFGLLPDEGGKTKSEAASSGASRKGNSRAGGRKGRRSSGGHHGVDGALSGQKRGSTVGELQRSEWNEIPFSWVVRGRQESHLINQQVRLLYYYVWHPTILMRYERQRRLYMRVSIPRKNTGRQGKPKEDCAFMVVWGYRHGQSYFAKDWSNPTVFVMTPNKRMFSRPLGLSLSLLLESELTDGRTDTGEVLCETRHVLSTVETRADLKKNYSR